MHSPCRPNPARSRVPETPVAVAQRQPSRPRPPPALTQAQARTKLTFASSLLATSPSVQGPDRQVVKTPWPRPHPSLKIQRYAERGKRRCGGALVVIERIRGATGRVPVLLPAGYPSSGAVSSRCTPSGSENDRIANPMSVRSVTSPWGMPAWSSRWRATWSSSFDAAWKLM